MQQCATVYLKEKNFLRTRKWSEDGIRELIFEMSPALWDIHSAEYRNRTIKQKALKELETEFCVDGIEQTKERNYKQRKL